MKRGDLITVAMAGDFAKPRPALIIQSNLFAETGTVTVLLMTTALVEAPLLRPTVQPSATNGLKKVSQVMIDKTMSIKRERCGAAFGYLDDANMVIVARSLALFLGLA